MRFLLARIPVSWNRAHRPADSPRPHRPIRARAVPGPAPAARLSSRGRKDARALATGSAPVAIDRVVTSPLSRAVDTAGDRGPRRRHRGRAGRPPDRARLRRLGGPHARRDHRRLPGEYEQYERDPATHHVGGGESGYEVVARLRALIDELLGWCGGVGDRTVLLVGHSSVNRIALAMSLGVR